MNIKPIGKRVLIELDTAPKTKGGLLLPGSKEKPTHGKVIAIGDVKDIKVGDQVFFTAYTGAPVPGSDDFIVLDIEDIMGVMI